MPKSSGFLFDIVSSNLADLLDEARARLKKEAQRHATQRGSTHAVNRVALTWRAPHELDTDRLPWSAAATEWYLDTFADVIDDKDTGWYLARFVDKRPENNPEILPQGDSLLFPYTYAARTRFWDGGWGYFVTLLHALREAAITLDQAYASFDDFAALIAEIGERLHLQLILSYFALYMPDALHFYLAQPALARNLATAWRTDQLEAAIEDIGANPHSRRAVVGPLNYPHLERQLAPQMGKPPYQLFQFLPGDAATPLSTIHEHRSLDVVGGAQLDFMHDLRWLGEACHALGRAPGDITIVAHNLHEYADPPAGETIEQWLCRVTDGYRSGQGIPRRLLAQPAYAANARRIWEHWHAEDH
jgi:hypothetical protein